MGWRYEFVTFLRAYRVHCRLRSEPCEPVYGKICCFPKSVIATSFYEATVKDSSNLASNLALNFPLNYV